MGNKPEDSDQLSKTPDISGVGTESPRPAQEEGSALTVAEIIAMADCPYCRAQAGRDCWRNGRGYLSYPHPSRARAAFDLLDTVAHYVAERDSEVTER